MGNNTKSEQDDLCLALINPELCKRSSIEVAIEQHDTETTIPYLHVFLDNMWDLKNCAFVWLDKPEYVPEKNSIRLSTKQKEELIYILTSESKYHWTTSIVDKNNIKIATGYWMESRWKMMTIYKGKCMKIWMDDIRSAPEG